jgi:gamma-glutamylcyclotransferase (GGCT)/AIG2-like uncharacterized protein YtfP
MALFTGAWPYLVETPPAGVEGARVMGELYDVASEIAMRRLDQLEEGYRKDLVVVSDAEGRTRVALTYFGDTVPFDSAQKLRYIAGGDLTKEFPPDKKDHAWV